MDDSWWSGERRGEGENRREKKAGEREERKEKRGRRAVEVMARLLEVIMCGHIIL